MNRPIFEAVIKWDCLSSFIAVHTFNVYPGSEVIEGKGDPRDVIASPIWVDDHRAQKIDNIDVAVSSHLASNSSLVERLVDMVVVCGGLSY